MRSWKKASRIELRIYLYFRAHPEIYFTPEHVAAQVKTGEDRTRAVIYELQKLGKLVKIEAVSALRWGRPKWMFRAIRTTDDSLEQVEAFTEGKS